MRYRSRRITRYVLGELLPPTLLGLALYTFVLLMNAFFLVAEKAISQGLGWEITFRLLIYELPKLLVLTIPMATLLGTLIALGRLSADHEWVAMQGAGLGTRALLKPVAIHGLVAALVSLGIYAFLFPRTHYAYRQLRSDAAVTASLAADLRPRVFYTDLPGIVLYVDEIRPGTRGRLDGVLIHRTRAEGGFDQIYLAREGDLYPSPDGSGNLELDLRDGVLHAYRPDVPDPYRSLRFERYHLELPAPDFLRAFQDTPLNRTVLDMGPAELRREWLTAQEQPQPAIRKLRLRRVAQEIHQRFALPAAAFLFAILAVPLGIVRVRTGKGAGFALSLIVIVVYWVLFTFTRDQATQGGFPVALGVWAANIFILVWFLFGIWRLRRRKGSAGVLMLLSRGILHLFRRFWSGLSRLVVPSPSGMESIGAEDEADVPVPGGSTVRVGSYKSGDIALVYLRVALLALATAFVVYGVVVLRNLADQGARDGRIASLLLEFLTKSGAGFVNFVLPVAVTVAAVVAFLTILDRRISLLYLRVLGLALASTYIVYAIVELKNLLEASLRNQQPLILILAYFKYFTPGMFNLVLPISCLVAAVVTYTLLARKGELTAVMASGMSLRRATIPVLMVTFALCAVFFLVQDRIVPQTSAKAQETKDQILGRAPRTYGLSPSGRWSLGTGNRLYHYRLYDADANRFQGLTVFTLDRNQPSILGQMFSPIAQWNGSTWSLGPGWSRTFPGDGTAGEYEKFASGKTESLTLPPTSLAASSVSPAEGISPTR